MTEQASTLDQTRSTQVLHWLVDAIRRGEFCEGDQLPSERALAERLDVGRSSLREALSILAALGVVDRHVGVGTHVLTRNERILDRVLQTVGQDGSLRDTFEFQRILEVGVAELAARRMTPEQLERIRCAFSEMADAAERGRIDDYFRANRAFHGAIAQATENVLLQQEVYRLFHFMDRPLWHEMKQYLMRSRSEYLARSVRGLGRLLDAFEDQDTARACHLMEEHFFRIERELFDGDD